MKPSLLTKIWRRIHIRMAAQQRQRTAIALGPQKPLSQLATLMASIEAKEREDKLADLVRAVNDGWNASQSSKHGTRAARISVDGHTFPPYGYN